MLELIRKILAPFQQKKKKINLSDYPVTMDYGTLTHNQQNAFDSILSACKSGVETAFLPTIAQAAFDEMVLHFKLYFGTYDKFQNIALLRYDSEQERHYAIVNLDLYRELKAHKDELDAWVDSALSQLNEGTTEDKLEQIAKCISNHARYKRGSNNPLDLGDGAKCGAYSMMFYKMASRLGVKTHICYGYARGIIGMVGHGWNMVELEKNYFYDVTWYDTGLRNPKYLHSETPWGREYKLTAR